MTKKRKSWDSPSSNNLLDSDACFTPCHNDAILEERVICSKVVQKVAQIDIPLFSLNIALANAGRSDFVEIGPGGTLTPAVDLIVDESGISQNIVLLRDKVINLGFVPVTITVGGIPVSFIIFEIPAVGGTTTVVTLPFQEETDCPGACPEDTVIEAPLQVETSIVQPIPAVLSNFIGQIASAQNTIRFKVILRTTITVVRPVIRSKDSCFSDVNQHRCETPNPSSVTLPVPTPNGGTQNGR